jgi:Skp family chaperone for outer membrane proteins
MNKFICLTFLFFSSFALAQEQAEKQSDSGTFKALIGVVDMKKILAQSKAYQSLVDQFENVRRKQRNTFTKQEDIIRDEESNLLKQKNVLSKEAYAEKVNELGKKINELKLKQSKNAKKFEIAFEKSTNKIQGALVDVLSMIANKNKLDLVLAKSQVILVGKDIDLTDGAIAELNKVLPTISMDK